MRFEFKVTAVGDATDKYGNPSDKQLGLLRLEAYDHGNGLAEALANIVRFAVLASKNVEISDVIGKFSELVGATPEVYETAAERAANAACVTLMRGVDGRLCQMQKMIDRLALKVEE